MKYLDPKADLTFKKIFGNHPNRMRNLLNALQSLNEDELIQQEQYLPTTEELEISGFTDAELRAYDKFWDAVSVEKTLQYDSYQQGMEKGMEKGRACDALLSQGNGKGGSSPPITLDQAHSRPVCRHLWSPAVQAPPLLHPPSGRTHLRIPGRAVESVSPLIDFLSPTDFTDLHRFYFPIIIRMFCVNL